MNLHLAHLLGGFCRFPKARIETLRVLSAFSCWEPWKCTLFSLGSKRYQDKLLLGLLFIDLWLVGNVFFLGGGSFYPGEGPITN